MEKLEGRDSRRVAPEKGRHAAEPKRSADRPRAGRGGARYAMHAKGVVHRDVKPSNVFYTEHGVVKVVDFGVAAFHGTGERLTRAGNVVGTAEYMAPEAARGLVVDGRGDVYLLATLAYEVLTGALPFTRHARAGADRQGHERSSEAGREHAARGSADLECAVAAWSSIATRCATLDRGRISCGSWPPRLRHRPKPARDYRAPAPGPRVPAKSGVSTRPHEVVSPPSRRRAGPCIAGVGRVARRAGCGLFASGLRGTEVATVSPPVGAAYYALARAGPRRRAGGGPGRAPCGRAGSAPALPGRGDRARRARRHDDSGADWTTTSTGMTTGTAATGAVATSAAAAEPGTSARARGRASAQDRRSGGRIGACRERSRARAGPRARGAVRAAPRRGPSARASSIVRLPEPSRPGTALRGAVWASRASGLARGPRRLTPTSTTSAWHPQSGGDADAIRERIARLQGE